MTCDVRYEEAIDRLLTVIPELRSSFNIEAAKWTPGLPHPDIVFGTLFSDFVTGIVHSYLSGNKEQEEPVNRAFAILEELSCSSDFNTRCLAEVSVLESLLGDEGGAQIYMPFLGPKTKVFAQELARRWQSDMPK